MNIATTVFNKYLESGREFITKDEMKKQEIDNTIFIARVKSLAGEIIYIYQEHLLHKISEDTFKITKIK